MSAPQNTPYQDAQGRWCCPRCGAARFRNKMEVLGHFRACKPGEPFFARPRYHAPVAEPPAVVAPTAATMVDGLVVSSIADPALMGRLARIEAGMERLEQFETNHIAHLSAQQAGGGGLWQGLGSKLAGVGAVAAVPIILALVAQAGNSMGRRRVPLVVTRRSPSKARPYGGKATCDPSGNCADDPNGNCDCDAEGRCVCEYEQGESSSSSSSRGKSLLSTAKDALAVVGGVKKLVG